MTQKPGYDIELARVFDAPRERVYRAFTEPDKPATAPIRFRPEYEHRRVNITMLYGDRAEDRHHPSPTAGGTTVQAPAWRSSALSRVRR